MIATLVGVQQRVLAQLGRLSMYRLTLYALIALAVVAVVESALGWIGVTPLDVVASLALLLVATFCTDAVAQALLRVPRRIESSLITALILLFVVQPGANPDQIGGIALAGVVASASKYVLVWRGRHLLNPAAVGATVLTLTTLGFSAWWVGTPALALPVVLLGLLVLWRTERVAVVLLFVAVYAAVSTARLSVQSAAAGIAVDPAGLLTTVLLQSPVLFLGAFMLTEPLTLPARRGQQLLVAAVVGVLAGWPLSLGVITLGQERALLVGNLLAAVLVARSGIRLSLVRRRALTPTVHELTFRTRRRFRFAPGQYLELQVPHRRPDARGTRREFSIVSAPAELPFVRIAYREAEPGSTFKRALGVVQADDVLTATGVWGDFVLPARDVPVLLLAAGIGVTPFVSQLGAGDRTDCVLVLVASSAQECAYLDELAASGARIVVVTPDRPEALPAGTEWAGGGRLDAALLRELVPDLARRHAYVSGPPRLLADLAPSLRGARRVTTDAFAGY
ncbi:flavodoxin reductase [Microbacterium sp.]|uniref:FAD-dependent oxidoreductase n=1 Tax=Microbacterium sp. TaxID=51671 RepID=UPI001AC7102D|nr:flavodoxin reductase [Microbacterium sp.]MBN9156380.1 flavodoxin reductase [Microbacterium sp.]MBS1899102.1 flavodoxin reductase [Actinomycetota bacterium]